MNDPMQWALVVEDRPSEYVLRRIVLSYAPNWSIEMVDNCGGFGQMKKRMPRYRNASHVIPHFLLTDLDDYECPASLMSDWQATSDPPRLIFRIAVREVEAWILGDRHGISEWMRIPVNKVPSNPEAASDPKAVMLSLGSKSQSRRFRQEFCPAPGSSASQGPLYNELLCRFILEAWNIDKARRVAPSLDRACAQVVRICDATD